jgi:nicotinamide-nucleotide amidase
MENPVGTALGMIFKRNRQLVFVMPGVPREMEAMLEGSVIPRLKRECPECRVLVDLFRTTGIPESAIFGLIENEMHNFSSYEIAFLPKFTGVDIRVIRSGKDILDKGKFDKFKNILYNVCGDNIYTTENLPLEAVLGNLLREKDLTLSVAESLTGGLVQHKLTQISGSSDYFMGGIIAYSNEAKIQLLSVRRSSLEKHGAVSELVAQEMASGVREVFSTSLGISTTGIAGPTGATPNKPLGLVYIGIASADGVISKKLQLGRDREINKERSAQAVLELARRTVLGLPV